MNTSASSYSPTNLNLPSEADQALINSRLRALNLHEHPLRSLQIYNLYAPGSTESTSYSRLQILQSSSGYYIGTLYIDRDHLWESIGSRDTTYFPDIEKAIRALSYMIQLSISGNSEYPFDLAQWERTLTAEFKLAVKYLYEPAH